MAFNIQKFRSSFGEFEPASPTNYEVIINKKPVQYSINGNVMNEDLSFEDVAKYRCITCSMPGKQLTTTDRLTYGPVRRIVTGAQYQDVVFSFIVSDDMEEKRYFNRWQTEIVDNMPRSGNTPHDVSYYADYVANEMLITQYSKSGVPQYIVRLLGAYPINVEEIPLSWEMNNEYIKITVTMAYRFWESVSLDDPSVQVAPPPKLENKTVPYVARKKSVASTLGNKALNNFDLAPDFTPKKIVKKITKPITDIFRGNGGKFGGGGASGDW